MQRTIALKRQSIAYTLRRSPRARVLRLAIASGGAVTVTAPPWMRQSAVERFIFEKSAWLSRKLKYFKQFPPKVFIKNRRLHFAEHKERARALVLARLKYFSQFYPHTKQLFGVGVYGFRWNKVVIRNQRSRWGSCSRKGNLNFNYKLALLPAHLADYIIIHELCHLSELNHSQRFWALVGKTMPEHRKMRRELRKVGMSLL